MIDKHIDKNVTKWSIDNWIANAIYQNIQKHLGMYSLMADLCVIKEKEEKL